jgi:hypothetical protein
MKIFTGCLSVVGGLVAIFVIISLFAANQHTQPQIVTQHVASAARLHSPKKVRARPAALPADACDIASSREHSAVAHLDNDQYQAAYDDAVSGLNHNDNCSYDDAEMVNKGYLLSIKALAEHHLSSGDSQTDLNQANQLLVECQTQPGLYGTSTAASCETQEQNNISQQTNWEMQSYQ